MKAITILQPYASAIACGLKQFETRSTKIKFRGRIAIHAGLSDELLEESHCTPDMLGVESFRDLPFGAIVATAKVVDCLKVELVESTTSMAGLKSESNTILFLGLTEISLGDFTKGRFAWQLAEVKKLDEPIFVKGKQGLWVWDE